MPFRIFQKGLTLLLKKQTNILSAAYAIMATVILSQFLGLLRDRLLVSIFGASNTLGIYNYSYILPDTIFQLTIAAALASAFIPVFSDYLSKGKEEEAHRMASTLLSIGLVVFSVFSLLLILFSKEILSIFNAGSQFSPEQMSLMINMTRIIIIGQMLFIVGSFFTALLQSYNHFFIPGIAAALYNLGIIIGVLLFHKSIGIYSAPIGVILGAVIFILFQIPLAKKIGYHFKLSFDIRNSGIRRLLMLMWPRTVQVAVQQVGLIFVAVIIGFLVDPGRMKLLFDYAKTLMFVPVSLFGFSIAQAAFPVLAKEKDRLDNFKNTFMSSFNQMLYLILPVSALILVLRIPIVRLVYGADKFDWPATVLTGRTLAFLSISIFAQAVIILFYRAFYALHNSVIPLIVSAFSTVLLIVLSFLMVVVNKNGIESVAFAFTIANIAQFLILFVLLDKKTGGFEKVPLFISLSKFFLATLLTGIAVYLPIKLLDQLVFDTTRTIDLIMLTGVSGVAGLTIYLFLTWLFSIKEAYTYIYVIKKIGNWREILRESEGIVETRNL